MGFNSVYMNEILGIADALKVKLEMNTQISACLVTVAEKDEKKAESEDLFLIMPLRLMDDA
jgi:DNA polymerase III sliding clamp (beta) subunit (PCNA family)